ncbi:MAG: UPF0058 family protein [Halobacteriales archaeon]|nr:UPF0058 family protein [Halobacteriales archaeon]
MKKRELLHLHGLLAELRRYLEDEELVPDHAFEQYDDRAVSPLGVQERKEKHRIAVLLLRDGLAETVEESVAHQLPEDGSIDGESPTNVA